MLPPNSNLSSGPGMELTPSKLHNLQSLTKCNSELLQKLDDKEKLIFQLNKELDLMKEKMKKQELLEKELEEAKQEIKKLKIKFSLNATTSSTSSPTEDSKDQMLKSGLTESQLIIQLQKQLESERLNSRNLKQQLELDRAYWNRIAQDKNMTSFSNGSGVSSSNGSSLRSNRTDDSLGLRSLLSNMPTLNSNTMDSLRTSSSTSSLGQSTSVGGAFGGLPSLSSFPSASPATSGNLFSSPPPTSMQGAFHHSLLSGTSSTSFSTPSNSGLTPAATDKLHERVLAHCPGMTRVMFDRYLNRVIEIQGSLNNCTIQKVVQLFKALYDQDKARPK